ncbi:zinc finger protein isoform X2 [Ciona intestinalis]
MFAHYICNARQKELNSVAYNSSGSSIFIFKNTLFELQSCTVVLTMDYINQATAFLNLQWSNILHLFGNEEKNVFVIGTSLVLFLSFCAVNSFFMFLDFTGKPKFLHKYKIQKDKNIPVEPARFLHCCRVAFRNELLSCGMVMLLYPIMKYTGMTCQAPLPPIWKGFLHFVAFVLVDEFIFYYSHRLFHHPFIYKHIHKMHHEWIAPISIAASYAHPIEHIVSNALPLLVGPILMGSHIAVVWIWLVIAQFETCLHHCNYHFPVMSSPQFHDYHHVKFNECFGTNGLLDWVHKTDVQFKKSIQAKRHITYYGIGPITKLFPSKDKKEN